MFQDKIKKSFELFPTRNAFCIKGSFYTYQDLALTVAGIQKLISTKHPAEQRFGVLLHDDIETYATITALLLLGKTYIPINPHHPSERISQVVEQADLLVVLNDRNAASNSHGHSHGDLQYQYHHCNAHNAYILFTSGSTGVPKGVPISYGNLDSFTDAFFALGYDVTEHDHFLQMFDLTFDLSVMSYLIPLCIGACVYTVPENGIKYLNIATILEDQSITFALMVPSILSSLRPYFAEIELPQLRYSLFCGEALYTQLAKEWKVCAPNARIDNVYGPTEATIFCLAYTVPADDNIVDHNGIVTIGTPMQGMDAIVADAMDKETAVGEKGELCLTGSQLTSGYLDDNKTQLAFFENSGKRYYRTGDIAYQQPDGNFIYCGRTDHQVKIQGYRVELSEVEFHARASITDTNLVAMMALNQATGLNQIEIVIEGSARDTDVLAQQLRQRLPVYMMPTVFHFLAVFPINTSGKTDRNAIKKLTGR